MKLSKAQLKALILISAGTRTTLNANTTCSLESKGLITRNYKNEIPQELTDKGYLYLYNYHQIDSAPLTDEQTGGNPFEKEISVGDTVLIFWLATDKLELVSFRGYEGENAIIIKDGLQLSVPKADIIPTHIQGAW